MGPRFGSRSRPPRSVSSPTTPPPTPSAEIVRVVPSRSGQVTNPGMTSLGNRLDTHPGIDHHHALTRGQHLHRVEIHLDQLGHDADETRDPQQSSLQLRNIALSGVAVALEQPKALGLPHHFPSIDIGEV